MCASMCVCVCARTDFVIVYGASLRDGRMLRKTSIQAFSGQNVHTFKQQCSVKVQD